MTTNKKFCKSKSVRKKRKRTEAELCLMAEQQAKADQRPPPPKLVVKILDGVIDQIAHKNSDEDVSSSLFRKAFGTTDFDFTNHQMNLLISAVASTGELTEIKINASLSALYGIDPRDEIEGMLSTQMIAVQNAAMKMAERLANSETIEQQNSAVNAMTKLNRTYVAQIEALNRYRGKGQQKMTVEHVHVNEGGQAIIGNVNKGGGGDEKK